MTNYIHVDSIITCLACNKQYCGDCHKECPYCHPEHSTDTAVSSKTGYWSIIDGELIPINPEE